MVPFVTMTASTLLDRLSTRFWDVSLGICVLSFERVFMKSGGDVGQSNSSTINSNHSSQSQEQAFLYNLGRHLRGPSPEMSGPEQTLMNSPITLSLLHYTSQLAQCTQADKVLLASINSRLDHRTAKKRSVICPSSEQWRYTLHHSIWWSALDFDPRPECSCSIMETCSIKLLVQLSLMPAEAQNS